MRIGMMADAYKPHISGVTHYIALNKQYLESMGHEVFVFTFGEHGGYIDEDTNVIRSPALPLDGTGFYLGMIYGRNEKQLLQTMDIVHVHHPFQSGRLALRYCKPLGIPVVFTNHTRYDLAAQAYLPMIPDELSETFLRTYLPQFCRDVDLVISPSNGMAKVLRGLDVDAEIKVIPNGIDLEKMTRCEKILSRADVGLDENNFVYIYTGRLAPEKNISLLISSFKGVAHAYPHARLLIIGDGPEKGNLLELVSNLNLTDQVRFTGMVPYEDLAAYLKLADVYTTASISEVHPLTLIEAMAMGLPVVGVESPGVGDTVIHEQTGYLSTNDLSVFTAMLTRIIADHDSCIRMGKRALEEVKQYSIQFTGKQVLEQYERLFSMSQKKSLPEADLTE
jgi:glycosyltransferase involved in cell wall biosynthesis